MRLLPNATNIHNSGQHLICSVLFLPVASPGRTSTGSAASFCPWSHTGEHLSTPLVVLWKYCQLVFNKLLCFELNVYLYSIYSRYSFTLQIDEINRGCIIYFCLL